MARKPGPGRRSSGLTAEQKLFTKRYIREVLVSGIRPEEMLEDLKKAFTEKGWQNYPSIAVIKACIKTIRHQLEREWAEVTKQSEANKRLLHLQLEAMYARAMKNGDPKVAHGVWKDLYLMLIPKKPRGGDSSPQDEEKDDFLSDEDLDSMSDEALEAAVEAGVQSGVIDTKVADYLIEKDQK